MHLQRSPLIAGELYRPGEQSSRYRDREGEREAIPTGYCQRSGDERPGNQSHRGGMIERLAMTAWGQFSSLIFCPSLLQDVAIVGHWVEVTQGL